MSRGVWVQHPRTGELIPRHLYHRDPVARSDLPAPMLIRDQLDYVMNPANGQRYTSKRAYEKAVRAAGCEIIGNEKPSASAPPSLADPAHDIVQAIEEVQSRSAPAKRKARKRGTAKQLG
jgi:hypothetical protein